MFSVDKVYTLVYTNNQKGARRNCQPNLLNVKNKIIQFPGPERKGKHADNY